MLSLGGFDVLKSHFLSNCPDPDHQCLNGLRIGGTTPAPQCLTGFFVVIVDQAGLHADLGSALDWGFLPSLADTWGNLFNSRVQFRANDRVAQANYSSISYQRKKLQLHVTEQSFRFVTNRMIAFLWCRLLPVLYWTRSLLLAKRLPFTGTFLLVNFLSLSDQSVGGFQSRSTFHFSGPFITFCTHLSLFI